MDIITERNELFDEDFRCKSDDIDRLVNFCKYLEKLSGVYCITSDGMMYEYLPRIYASVVTNIEVQDM